jgi:lactobin A/cerein 7B family class IIb bacteriocin
MTKKFELSAYGVEEMNQKELVDVEGGSIVGVVLLIILGVGALIGAGMLSNYLNENYFLEYQGINTNGYHQYELKRKFWTVGNDAMPTVD